MSLRLVATSNLCMQKMMCFQSQLGQIKVIFDNQGKNASHYVRKIPVKLENVKKVEKGWSNSA